MKTPTPAVKRVVPPILPYKNPALPVAKCVKDLLSRMTLDEKATQMMCVWQKKSETLVNGDGNFDLKKAQAAFKKGHGLGPVGRPSDAGRGKDARCMAELTNAIQKFFLEHSLLGILVMFHEECLHGQAAIGSTSFPQPIGLAATFNLELVEALYKMTAEEARVRGTHQALTPVVDVARDPRWGRVEETFGEDPFLVTQLGMAAVRGFQGDASFKDKKRIIATLKHFAAYGQPESGQNCAPVNSAMLATGKPVIVFLFNGSPLSIQYLNENVPVIFECWYLGQESGHAVADVLFGDCNPGGKLPMTIPRSAGHLPAFYNYKPSARRGYLFDDVSPLYPFGFGLSYTTFAIKNPSLAKNKIRRTESTRVLVDVKNTGKRAGTEVVQMYICDCVSSVTRPVKELKGFQKISLRPGETRTVALDITPDLLSFYDLHMKYVVEPGEFEIMVGNSSRDGDLQKVILTVT